MPVFPFLCTENLQKIECTIYVYVQNLYFRSIAVNITVYILDLFYLPIPMYGTFPGVIFVRRNIAAHLPEFSWPQLCTAGGADLLNNDRRYSDWIADISQCVCNRANKSEYTIYFACFCAQNHDLWTRIRILILMHSCGSKAVCDMNKDLRTKFNYSFVKHL